MKISISQFKVMGNIFWVKVALPNIKCLNMPRCEAGVRVVFVQQEFDRKHAESLAAEIGARIVMINPLSADWKTEMLRIAQSLATP